MKKRQQKEIIYNEKYLDIPRDYNERINWMISKYHISEKQMESIIYRKRNIESNIRFSTFVLILYEEPEGTPRPRFRIVNRSNYHIAAINNPSFVHVYQPNAYDDSIYMHRMVEEELTTLNSFIQTPCKITLDCFFKTPSNYNVSDKIIAEYGLDWNIKKPDWDNIGKKYSDMYNANIWLDDSLVISGTVNKYYSILPRVEITLQYMNVVPNIHQYNSIIKKKDYNQDQPINYLNRNGIIYKGEIK